MKTYYYVIILIILLLALLLLMSPKASPEQIAIQVCLSNGGVYTVATHSCTIQTATTSAPVSVYSPANAVDQIKIIVPAANEVLPDVGPFIVRGEAVGKWYFEASFPILLTDEKGTVIAQTNASAEGEWMTPSFVPFTGKLSYPLQPSGSNGFIILKNDNPSGLSQNEMSVKIPVTFK